MKVYLNFVLICSLSGLPKIKVEDVRDPAIKDLVNEYYTPTPAVTDQYIEQDSIDAQAIWEAGNGQSNWHNDTGKAFRDSDTSKKVIASILLYREKIRCYAINNKILEKVDAENDTPSDTEWEKLSWITERYTPDWREQFTLFLDLCYGLIEDENVVLSGYLYNFFDSKDKPWIVIAMVLTKNMEEMTKTYNEINDDKNAFEDDREELEKPFENMTRVWTEENREPIETDNLDDNSTTKDADDLKSEQDYGKDSGCWNEDRDVIESILMKKSIKYARAVIEKFEKANGGKTIDSIIVDCRDNHGLDYDLAEAYSSLALYIKDKYSYIAGILHQHSDEEYSWAVWVMCVAVIHRDEWPKVDAAFQKLYKEDANSLSDYILKKLDDKIMAEAIAVIVDRKFKPTQFKEQPVQGGPAAPPAVSPTVPAHP